MSGLRRSVRDAGFSELRRQLTYKATDRGNRVVVIDRFYPSSKTCSSCGEVRAKLALNERVFECLTCGINLDRDVNASRNIEQEGLRLLGVRSDVAGFQPETLNAVLRRGKTSAVSRGAPSANRAEPRNHLGIEPNLVLVVEGVLVTASGVSKHELGVRDSNNSD
jgi:putative transposase